MGFPKKLVKYHTTPPWHLGGPSPQMTYWRTLEELQGDLLRMGGPFVGGCPQSFQRCWPSLILTTESASRESAQGTQLGHRTSASVYRPWVLPGSSRAFLNLFSSPSPWTSEPPPQSRLYRAGWARGRCTVPLHWRLCQPPAPCLPRWACCSLRQAVPWLQLRSRGEEGAGTPPGTAETLHVSCLGALPCSR